MLGEEKIVTIEVEFEAMLRQPDINIGGVGGFDLTHAVTTAKGCQFIDIYDDENIKNRLESIMRANGVDLIEVRILNIWS